MIHTRLGRAFALALTVGFVSTLAFGSGPPSSVNARDKTSTKEPARLTPAIVTSERISTFADVPQVTHYQFRVGTIGHKVEAYRTAMANPAEAISYSGGNQLRLLIVTRVNRNSGSTSLSPPTAGSTSLPIIGHKDPGRSVQTQAA